MPGEGGRDRTYRGGGGDEGVRAVGAKRSRESRGKQRKVSEKKEVVMLESVIEEKWEREEEDGGDDWRVPSGTPGRHEVVLFISETSQIPRHGAIFFRIPPTCAHTVDAERAWQPIGSAVEGCGAFARCAAPKLGIPASGGVRPAVGCGASWVCTARCGPLAIGVGGTLGCALALHVPARWTLPVADAVAYRSASTLGGGRSVRTCSVPISCGLQLAR